MLMRQTASILSLFLVACHGQAQSAANVESAGNESALEFSSSVGQLLGETSGRHSPEHRVLTVRAYILLLQAELQYRFLDKHSALTTYVRVLERHPRNILANLRLAEHLAATKDYQGAVYLYEQARLGGFVVEYIFDRIAETKMLQNDLLGARRTLLDGTKAFPRSANLKSKLGYATIKLGLIDEGIAAITDALKIDNANADAYASRAYGYALNRNWARAKADLDMVLTLQPMNVYSLVDRGAVKLYSGDARGAATDLTSAILTDEVRAGVAGAFIYRAQANAILGMQDFATRDRQRAQEFPEADAHIIR
jgi:tetratricopeptide (TPR) repeat protein